MSAAAPWRVHVTATSTMQPQQAPPGPGSREMQEQIRQTIIEAQAAAREAQAAGREAQAAARAEARAQGRDIRVVIPGVPPFPDGPRGGGFTIQNEPWHSNGIPPQAVDIAMGFFTMCAVIVIGWPLARAFGRRMERRSDVPAAINPAVTDQLQRIEQAVEAMSIEVERISESQRFMARLQSAASERVALPADRS